MREWLWKITSAAALILFVCGLLQSHHETNLIKRAENTEKHLEKRIFEKEEANDEEDVFTQLRDINPDFRALLEFESGLIRLPVVQADDNSRYLNHLFDGSEGITGSLFFDMQCEQDDELRVIYGHSVFGEGDTMFTPLHQLRSQEFFEENRIFTLRDGETEEVYEIISVFINDEASMNALDTRIRSFISQNDKEAFIQEAIDRSLVHTDTAYDPQAKALILQTCMDLESLERLCVLAVMKQG
jgi:sortase B